MCCRSAVGSICLGYSIPFDSLTVILNPLFLFLYIKGWDEGFASMKKGEKCHLRCREDYAYGSQPPGAGIPPNATLNFDVELLGFGPKKL